mgnify:FL=1|tara:strand:- start:1854 stop:2258 length:405 start_codon:yes stop_codon:yes gene_type:complete
MIQNDLDKLGQFLARKRHTAFELSVNDCNTLAVEWHDLRYGTNKLDNIKGQYHNNRTRIQFAKEYLSAETWLKTNGYKQVKTKKEGDLILVKHKYWSVVYIYFFGVAYTFEEGKNLVQINPKSFPKDQIEIWRR